MMNKRLMMVCLCLALLCACFFGSAAMAEGNEQEDWLIVTNAENENGVVSGKSLYYVEIDLEDSDSFQWCWTKSITEEPENWQTLPVSIFDKSDDDTDRRYFTTRPYYDNETGSYVTSDLK